MGFSLCLFSFLNLECGFFLCFSLSLPHFLSLFYFIYFIFLIKKIISIDFGSKRREGQSSLDVFEWDKEGNQQR
jgi:hypothetical protein